MQRLLPLLQPLVEYLMTSIISTPAFVLVFLATAGGAGAEIVAQSLNANGVSSPNFVGQSFTTGSSAQYSTISFNFYRWNPNAVAYAPADQAYYLLDEEYLGTNADLSEATDGYIAKTTGVSGDQWVFNPSVTLSGNTKYWLYGSGLTTSFQFVAGSGYSGGHMYASGAGAGNFFVAGVNSDLAFTINSNPTAEPIPLALSVQGLTGDTLTLTVTNIPSGQTLHLRQSTDLINFEPLSPPIDLTDTTPQPLAITIDPTTHPKLFFTVGAGASPLNLE